MRSLFVLAAAFCVASLASPAAAAAGPTTLVGNTLQSISFQEGPLSLSGEEGRTVSTEPSLSLEDIISGLSSPQTNSTTSSSPTGRVAYGNLAPQGSFPFAAFVYNDHFYCSGSVISPRAVLTAAHCVYGSSGWRYSASEIRVRIGNVNVNDAVVYTVKSMIIPNYNTNNDFGDILILQLGSATPASQVALPGPSYSLSGGTDVTVAGWGYAEDGNQHANLRYTSLAALSGATCRSVHVQLTGGYPSPGHYCFGSASQKSSCEGDSGGPYLVGKNFQVALVSYGPSGYRCGGNGALDVGTSTVYWSNWIQNMLSMFNLRGNSPPARLNKVENNKCFMGGNLRTLKTKNAGACCDLCRANGACQAWTWTTGKTCALKSSAGGVQSSSSCVSGYF